MTTGTEPWRLREASKNPAPPLRWLTLPVKAAGLLLGGCVTMLALMSLAGLFVDAVWLQALIAAVPAVGVPLLLVDRLLPKDGSARPGLGTDVAAVLWMGTATAAVAFGSSVMQAPLQEEATRLDQSGLHRTAWSVRWLAETDAPAATGAPPDTATVAAVSMSPPVAPEDPAKAAPEGEKDGAEFTPAPTESDRKPMKPALLFETWAPSVVTIKAGSEYGGGMGTGFVIDKHGTIATNHHVVENANRLSVKLFDGTEVDQVELLESNPEDDLALIRIRTENPLVPVVLGSSQEVTVGEPVIVIGNPIGLEHTLTDGLVSSRRLWEGKKYIQMSAPVSPGNSGGPVFNAYGDVVGVTVAKLRGENLNLAVPIDKLKPMIKDEYPSAKDLGESRW